MKRPTKERFAEKIKIALNGCHEWIGCIMPNGYGQFHLNGKTTYAHRVSYELFNGKIENNLFVLHSCDNRKCVNPEHLSLGTFDDNMSDMVIKGRQCSGIKNRHAKLDDKQVLQIRTEVGTQSQIAAKFCISPATVGDIQRRDTWRHI